MTAPPHGHGPAVLRVLLALLAAGAGVVVLLAPVGPAPAAAPARGTPAPVVLASRAPASPAAPARVRVPPIGVDTPLVGLGLDAAGALEAPAAYDRAGWFAGGTVPGEVGPAVVAGHVDSVDGPAVFARLRELVPGDEVLVDRTDGTTARFRVTDVERHPKDAFPTEAVYGPTADPQLRLVTCGGDFDRAARSYEDNVVVFATLVR
ncbi:sortase family protein [Geodermatophilus tzadiensis]|uniref:Sortase family protein n=1 Tax=Geodermatophilus tzadiensis TaxID=1137988 RepID=A0A2T0U188_9ACTN|nr:class F sortase [Geodermatophilus tzadiensis]PRY51669.1 sortase family protein [Geodermatophilus tzadiensis]